MSEAHIPSPEEQPAYNITGFAAASASPGSGTNISGAIFATFMKILNDFKATLGNNNQQLQLIEKITNDLNSLMSLFNEITGPAAPSSDAGQQITSTLGDLQGNINKIPGGDESSIKGILQQQFNSISALMTSNPFINICKQIETDLSNLNSIWSQLSQVGANISAIAPELSTDIGALQLDTTNLNSFVTGYSQANPPPPSILIVVQMQVNMVWANLNNIQVNENDPHGGGGSWTIGQVYPNGTGNMSWEGFVSGLNMALSIGGYWQIQNYNTYNQSVTTAMQELQQGVQWQGMSTQQLVNLIHMMAQPVSGESMRNAMAFLWNEYNTSQSALNQMLTASGSFTNQQITALSQAFASMQSVVQVLSQTESQLAGEVAKEVHRTSPFYH